MEKADLILAVFDGSRPLDDEDRAIIELVKETKIPTIALINKSDLTTVLDISEVKSHFEHCITLSAKGGDTDALRALVEALYTDETLRIGEEPIVSSARAHAALLRARQMLDCSLEAFASGFPADAASSDIELAIGALGEIDGRTVNEEIVADIFSKFCVGK
jgi:tRNA modification GTPase